LEGFFLSPQLPVAKQYFMPSVITLKMRKGERAEEKRNRKRRKRGE
jgi:hypothetical protein